ncbi:MAG: AMP-binding protein [Rhodospirillaceae bacterium]|nr:AMP-binding protein [Rhodospirillaceae bacterium]
MLENCVDWPVEFADKYRRKGYWQDINLYQHFCQLVERFGDQEAIVFQEQRLTFNQLLSQIDSAAAALSECGLKAGERVVFQLPNCPEFIVTFYALLKIGVIPVMALPPHRETEIKHFVNHAGAVAYFFPAQLRDFDYREMAENVRNECPSLKHLFVLGEARKDQQSLADFFNGSASTSSTSLVPASEVAFMLLSGGTTALPKLIPRTHNDYLFNLLQAASAGGLSAGVTFMAALPMAHNYTLGCPGFLGALAYGGRVVIATALDPETIFSLVEQEKINVIPAAIPLIVNWLNSDIPELFDLSSLNLITNGGAKLQPELRQQLEQKFSCIFQEIYGTAEGLLNFTPLDGPDDVRFNSSGKPLSADDEIKIIDDDGNELSEGELGELVVRGPYTIRGYYNAPENNANGFTDDGYYKMGDLVRLKDGYLYCEGRTKDLINRGGEKISCDEVEKHMLANSKIKSAALVAMPDPVFGEKACAFVILQPDQSLDLEDLKNYLLAQKIAKFKLPERLEIADGFPISPAGKILKKELRQIIAAKLEQESA